MVKHSQRITDFVTSELLSCEKPKHRARLFKFYMRLCVESWKKDDLHTVQAIVKAMLSGPADRLHKTKAKLAKRENGKKLMAEVERISQFYMLSFLNQKNEIQSRVDNNQECEPPILLFMNGWANVTEFNNKKFIPDTFVPHPDRTSVIANIQMFFSRCQSKLPVFRYQPNTDIAAHIDAQTINDAAKEQEQYKLARILEPIDVAQ